MSPKNSSLAYDELKEQELEQHTMSSFEPKLQLLVNGRHLKLNSFSSGDDSDIVQIGGRITVSF